MSHGAGHDGLTRRGAIAGLAAVGLSGCLGGFTGGSGGEDGNGTEAGTATEAAVWRTHELTDVLTGETFTIAGFEGRPVLVETFAVWCPTCTKQQREIRSLHERRDDVVSVSLNVDPNEDADQVRKHAETKGFDWRYVISPPEVTKSLSEAFGSVVTNPPSAPVIRVCPDGSASLVGGRGAKSASALVSAIEDC